MLNWMVENKDIEPHIPVFDKSVRKDGTFDQDAFTFESYIFPDGKDVKRYCIAGRREKRAMSPKMKPNATAL